MADPRPLSSFRIAAWIAAAVALWSAGPAHAQPATGVLVAVPNPLTSDAVTRIKNRLDTAFAKGDQAPATVVFDFNPGDKDASTADFGPAADLADYIGTRVRAATVAYVHQKVTGHAVLPVLACQQIVVGPRAALGEVADAPLTGFRENGYVEVLSRGRPQFVAVARKMADRGVELRRGKKGAIDWYVDLRDRAKFEKDGVTLTDTAPLPAAPDGKTGLFVAGQLRDLGLANGSAETLRELSDTYNLPAGSERDPVGGGRPAVGFRYVLRGPIDGGVKESVGRIVSDAVRNNATLVVLQLEVSGGDPQAARELAEKLIELQQGEAGVRVVAYIPDRAPDTAAVVALGCSEIVMSKRKDAPPGPDGPAEAEFGDFDTAAGKQMRAENARLWIDSLRELAERQGYPPLLIEGLFNPDLDIVRVHKKTDRSVRKFLTADELKADAAKGDASEYVVEKQVKARGQFLKLSATQAEEYGVARHTTEKSDINLVYAEYGLDPAKVKDATPAWLDRLANFLRNPVVTLLLVVIGFIGLILEIKVPGTTVPGIVAALCFILVFWAHTQFSGQVAVLAGLLFILGLVLVLLEVFVLPGFGVPGVVGIAFMLGALALATVGATDGPLPSTTAEWTRLGGKMGQYLFAMIGAAVLSFTIVRYLPNIPYANRLALAPPDDTAAHATANLPGATQAAGLIGAVGIAVTVLRPAGTVRFADDFVDVVTEGSYVPAGVRVQVVEVEGNRIVVREV